MVSIKDLQSYGKDLFGNILIIVTSYSAKVRIIFKKNLNLINTAFLSLLLPLNHSFFHFQKLTVELNISQVNGCNLKSLSLFFTKSVVFSISLMEIEFQTLSILYTFHKKSTFEIQFSQDA